MAPELSNLEQLYSDTQSCARLVGLNYVEAEAEGLARVKRGKGFTYKDAQGRPVTDAKLKQRLVELVIPPAWQDVWICPSPAGHILATGIDEKGRKQYIYHPKWRTMRDLIKFYRLIAFAKVLPKIRRTINNNLKSSNFGRKAVLAAMLWILDNAYIRVGNEAYFEQNASVGLTTLTDRNVVIAGPVVTLAFKGKSGKDQQITFENKEIARLLGRLTQVKGARLFRYHRGGLWHELESNDINSYLHEVAGAQITAKDFRTWGGTLIAFDHLIQDYKAEDSKKPEKAVVEAVDEAAAVLGNTRAVARSAYVHPDILSAYGSKNFGRYYAKARKTVKIPMLDRRESELLHFLEQLFEKEFALLRRN